MRSFSVTCFRSLLLLLLASVIGMQARANGDGQSARSGHAFATMDQDGTGPVVTAEGGTLTCAVDSVVLMGTGEGSYNWSGPGGFTSTQQNPTVFVAGIYVLVVTDADGDTGTAAAIVDQDFNEPDVTAEGGTLTCAVDSVVLTGIGEGSYNWSGPGGFTSNQQNPTATLPGIYLLVVTGANGCTGTAAAIVDQDLNVPGVTAQGGTLTCAADSVILMGTGEGSYSWSGPGGFTSTQQNPTATLPGNYALVVTGANGCTGTATAVVDQDLTPPGAQATGGSLSCETQTVQLQGSGNGSYAWSGPDGFTSSEQNPTVSAAGEYILVVTGPNGCSSTSTAQVVAQACGGCDTPIIIDPGPQLVQVECGASLDPEDIGYPYTRKNPECPQVVYFNYVDWSSGACPVTITRHWTFADVDGNQETCTQTIIVSDTQAPVLVSLPPDVTVPCDSVPAFPSNVLATDCKSNVTVHMQDSIIPGPDSTGYTIHRIFTATDPCGNTATATQVITVVGCPPACDTPIIIDPGPQLVQVECGASLDPEDIGHPYTRKTPECPQVVYFNYVDWSSASCPDTITRHWTFADVDGNQETCTQTIIVFDTQAPVLSCPSWEDTVDCEAIPEPVKCTATDNCDPDVQVSMNEEVGKGDCESGYTITRTYTATDDCGNTATSVQTIHVTGGNSGGNNGMAATATDGVVVAPNPFSGETTICFTSAAKGHLTVEVLDLLGQKAATLMDGMVEQGAPIVAEFRPGRTSAALYFYRITLNGNVTMGKLMYRP